VSMFASAGFAASGSSAAFSAPSPVLFRPSRCSEVDLGRGFASTGTEGPCVLAYCAPDPPFAPPVAVDGLLGRSLYRYLRFSGIATDRSVRRACIAAISSSVNPAEAREVDHEGGRPTYLMRIRYERED
jgi:hypothetical protein